MQKQMNSWTAALHSKGIQVDDEYIVKIIEKPLDQKTTKEIAMIEAIVDVRYMTEIAYQQCRATSS